MPFPKRNRSFNCNWTISPLILVTGGAGFLGNHLVDQLQKSGEPVRIFYRNRPARVVFDPDRVEWVQGDITNKASLEPAMAGVKRLYHVAGRVDFNPPTPDLLYAVNEQGTRNVLDVAMSHGVERVVHVSSVSTLGAAADPARPLTEADFGQGLGLDIPYPQSKYRGEKVALEFAQRGLPVVIVNPTFFAGPADWNLSSARTIISFLHRQVWVSLTEGSFGFTDVRDIAAGARAAMDKGTPGQRYILGGHNLTLADYHRLLERLTGLPAPRLRVPPRLAMVLAAIGAVGYRMVGLKPYVGPGDVRLARRNWIYDYSRARHELGLVCRTPEDSVRDTLAWLAEQGYYKPASGK